MASIFDINGIEVKASNSDRKMSAEPSLYSSEIDKLPLSDKSGIITQLSGILNKLTYNGATQMSTYIANNATTSIEDNAKKRYEPRQELNNNPLLQQIVSNSNSDEINADGKNDEDVIGKDFRKLDKLSGDDTINKYFSTYVKSISKKKISNEDIAPLKKEFMEYIKSPLYAERQAMNPEVYPSSQPVPEEFQNAFASFAAKSKQAKRLGIIQDIPVNLMDNNTSGEFVRKDGTVGSINVSSKYPLSVLTHEIAHGGLNALPNSDSNNALDFYNKRKENRGVESSKDINTFLNNKEIDKFLKYAKDADSLDWDNRTIYGDRHYDKAASDKSSFANEQYSDLNGVRKLLLDNGVTKSFGENLDKDKLEKAINNPEITKDPVFRRFYHRYGESNIIELNNTIAMNKKFNDTKNKMA
jgi:hypothetical protein